MSQHLISARWTKISLVSVHMSTRSMTGMQGLADSFQFFPPNHGHATKLLRHPHFRHCHTHCTSPHSHLNCNFCGSLLTLTPKCPQSHSNAHAHTRYLTVNTGNSIKLVIDKL